MAKNIVGGGVARPPLPSTRCQQEVVVSSASLPIADDCSTHARPRAECDACFVSSLKVVVLTTTPANGSLLAVRVCVCVYVYVRERERESQRPRGIEWRWQWVGRGLRRLSQPCPLCVCMELGKNAAAITERAQPSPCSTTAAVHEDGATVVGKSRIRNSWDMGQPSCVHSCMKGKTCITIHLLHPPPGAAPFRLTQIPPCKSNGSK